jgi:hypothetical protein
MIRILGRGATTCDGVTRREAMRVGALSLLAGAGQGASASTQAAASDVRANIPRARSIILINLFGGPPHMDMFDLKPNAPDTVRGEFKPIASSVPGLHIGELLPQIAGIMDRATLIRTYSHKYNSHNPYNVLTGFDGGNDQENYYAKRTDHPSIAAVSQRAGIGRGELVPYVILPAFPGYSQGLRRAGPYGGYLGSQYDPLFTTCDPKFERESKGFYDPVVPRGVPIAPTAGSGIELSADRLDRRRTLLEQLDVDLAAAERLREIDRVRGLKRKAFELISSTKVRGAFDITKESEATIERYGKNLWGASTLIARRLVEAGSTFVSVNWESNGGGHWDFHENNFGMLRVHLPVLDQIVSALVTDLDSRGLLDETLVILMGEMGRSPTINRAAGRDHWPQCGFVLLFGGGVKRGYVHGSTDKFAAYPTDRPVSAGDLAATIYHLIGIDPDTSVPDLADRPINISHGGRPVFDIMAT